jgi:hypothetical protein
MGSEKQNESEFTITLKYSEGLADIQVSGKCSILLIMGLLETAKHQIITDNDKKQVNG